MAELAGGYGGGGGGEAVEIAADGCRLFESRVEKVVLNGTVRWSMRCMGDGRACHCGDLRPRELVLFGADFGYYSRSGVLHAGLWRLESEHGR